MADPNIVRGILSNLIGLALLAGGAYAMKLEISAIVSLAINWVVFFIHALPFSSEKFFDATGSLTYLALIISAQFLSNAWSARRIVSSVMVCIWCTRLGSYLLQRILRDGKDARFDEFKVSCLRFMGVWTIQAVWCFLVAAPALVMITSPACSSAPQVLDYIGWAIWVCSFLMEVVADKQKDNFRRDPANKGKFITTGLWAYSRHPNYFGEICMWIGLSLSGSACFQYGQWAAWLSPLTTFVLLTKVSGVPLLEETGQKRWGDLPEYQHYMRVTPCIVPACRRPPAFDGESLAPASTLNPAGVGA